MSRQRLPSRSPTNRSRQPQTFMVIQGRPESPYGLYNTIIDSMGNIYIERKSEPGGRQYSRRPRYSPKDRRLRSSPTPFLSRRRRQITSRSRARRYGRFASIRFDSSA